MKHQKKILSAILFFALGITGLQAQQAFTASGGDASGPGGTVSYSVGQVAYTTNFGTNGSVAQGVQQPFEISVVTGVEQATGITLQCTVYPNPTTDFLTLKVENYDITNLSYQLFDINGKLIENRKVKVNETIITTSNLTVATYFLKVIQGNKEIKTFKIIKTN